MKYFIQATSIRVSAFLIISLLLPIGGFTQNIQWAQNYGGSGLDEAFDVQQTTDGGYIVAGSSNSSDNDVTANNGDRDYWVVKLDASGVIQWEQNYGGTERDIAFSVQQTAEGGYIVVGESRSDDVDVSGNNGFSDYWVVKLDASGNIEWEQSYGGSNNDLPNSIQQTSDGGYIVAGFSFSSDKDVSGNYGHQDYWVVKLDSAGSIEWEQNYGGSEDDRAKFIQQTQDAGYIVVGNSHSNDIDVSGNYGRQDYWVVKLDMSGNIQWAHNYGGSGYERARSIIQTYDGGYMLGGTGDTNDYDITGNYGNDDYWLVKLDATGAIEWEQNYGGSDAERLAQVESTADSGYIVIGWSASSDHDVSNNYGNSDMWVLKLDQSGNIQWEQNYGGSSADPPESIKQTMDGGYVLAGYTLSNDQDVSGNYGLFDFWLVKLEKPVGIESHLAPSQIVFYPNPTHGQLTIDLGAIAQSGEMVVLNALGQTVLKKSFHNCRIIDTKIEGARGLYLISVIMRNGHTATLKVFKQ